MRGGVLPFGPVGHGLGEGVFLGLVPVAHRPVAGGPGLVPPGPFVVAGLAGGFGLGVGCGSRPVQRSGRRGGPAAALCRRGGAPSRFRRRRCRGSATAGRRACRARPGRRRGRGRGRLRARRPAGRGSRGWVRGRSGRRGGGSRTFPGRRRSQAAFRSHPCRAAGSVGDWAEGVDRPCGRVLGGELAEAVRAVVHHRGDLGQVCLAAGIGEFGDAVGPGALRLGEQRVARAGGCGRR